ncbi:MAG: IS1182 family transposase [Thiotrichaceae bacterium]|nr:IS1182 family transposase [Thiotrichaceae bacterium]MBL1259317.1 IS1182 family transposase [Thiotrichaceae bacterium]MBL1261500.1 IS1182 family transposase [Thiotrichaceae bacterium]
MPKFIPNNYKQDMLIALNFEDQLQPGTFEHALHYLIDQKLDLSVFYPRYKNDDVGRPAYDPAMLLKIILFAYSKGITSSREIQWCCQYNIIFKALACNSNPHFTTIADFISSKPSDIEAIFEQILLICFDEGLLGNELFAIDGCKMRSDAAKTWSGTFKELGEKRDKLKRMIQYQMNLHQDNDPVEDHDDAREKRTAQTIDTLNKAHDKIERFLDHNEPRQGKGKKKTEVKSNITDNESAKMTTSKGTIQGFNGVASVDKKHQIIIDAQAFGEGQEHHVLKPVLNIIKERFNRLGISDDIYQDGIIVTADTGYANEDNMAYLHQNNIDAYIPDKHFRSRDPKFIDQKKKYGKRNQLTKKKGNSRYPATEFELNSDDKSCVCPAGKSLWLKNEKKDQYGNDKLYFEGRLTDCRDCEQKQQCMKKPDSADTRNGHGRQVSFIVKQRTPEPNYTDWMKARVDSDKGKQIYSHRMSVVEPVFANMGSNKGLNRFSLRGKAKVQGQWQLYCMVHNIEKLMNYGELRH